MRPLADLLLSHHLVDDEQLAGVYAEFGQDGRSFARVLVDRGVIAEPRLVALLAEQAGLPFVELSEITVDPSAVALVPAPLCRQYTVLPVRAESGRLVLATSDPANVFATDDVRSASGLELQLVVATRSDLQAAINRHLRTDDRRSRTSVPWAAPRTTTWPGSPRWSTTPHRQVRQPADHAGGAGPGLRHPHRARRARRCGCATASTACCTRCMRPPRAIQAGVISRLKIMADLDIAEPPHAAGRPTVGRPSTAASVDLRVATLPTVCGEKVVMRILDNNAVRLEPGRPGLRARATSTRFNDGFTRPTA